MQLLNRMSQTEDAQEQDAMIRETGERMNLSLLEILSEKSLYKRRRPRTDFISKMAPDEALPDLDQEMMYCKLNRIQMPLQQKPD